MGKLAVLKFYKVDSNDKVARLRRECPHELCGPGVFMAVHSNRYYCGKCHLTYLIKKGDEKWHKNIAVHISPCFRCREGDTVIVGQCRPLSKTVRFNVLKVIPAGAKQVKGFSSY